MNMKMEPVTASIVKEISEATNDAALILYPDGALGVLRSLTLELPDMPDDVIVLKQNAKSWINDMIATARANALEDGTSVHLSTLKKQVVAWANEELLEDERRSDPFFIPIDVIGGARLLREEIRRWQEMIQGLIPLIP